MKFLNWLNTYQGIAQWLSVVAVGVASVLAYSIGKRQNKINEVYFKLQKEIHVSLEIREKKIATYTSNKGRIWLVLIKNAGAFRPFRLVSYKYSDGPLIPLENGALISPGGSYPIPLPGKDIKWENSNHIRFLTIRFKADGSKYHAQYKLEYEEKIDEWGWYKVGMEADNGKHSPIKMSKTEFIKHFCKKIFSKKKMKE